MTLKSGGIDPQPFIQGILTQCNKSSKSIGNRAVYMMGNICSSILGMFGVSFNDPIVVSFTQYSQPVDPSQIPLLSYIAYEDSQDLSAQQITANLNDLLSQLNMKLGTLENEAYKLSQSQSQSQSQNKRELSLTPPSLPSDNSERDYMPSKRQRTGNYEGDEFTGGRRYRRRTYRRRSTKRRRTTGVYKKKRYTNRRRRSNRRR